MSRMISIQKIIRDKGLSIQTFINSATAEEYNKNRPAQSVGELSDMEFSSLKNYFKEV